MKNKKTLPPVTQCEIEYIEDEKKTTVLIAQQEEFYRDEALDEQIFFYGLSYEDCISLCENDEVIEDFFKIKEVIGSFEIIEVTGSGSLL